MSTTSCSYVQSYGGVTVVSTVTSESTRTETKGGLELCDQDLCSGTPIRTTPHGAAR